MDVARIHDEMKSGNNSSLEDTSTPLSKLERAGPLHPPIPLFGTREINITFARCLWF